MTAKVHPELTVQVVNFSAQDPGDGWRHLFALVEAADSAGVDRIIVSDHVVFGETLEDYAKPELGGRAGGRQPTGPDGHWLEPLTLLSIVAGMTKRIRLRTQILLAALRRPVTLAKSAATLDVLSGGRLDLGVGVGWQRAEYEAAGLSFENRGRLLDHTLEVCQVLWGNERASYSSPELHFDGIHQMPKPISPGGVPIWISGTIREATVRRLVRFGPRWIPWGPNDITLQTSIRRMKEELSKAGGDPNVLQVAGPLPTVKQSDGQIDIGRTMERVSEMVPIGQTDFVYPLRPAASRAETEDNLWNIVLAFHEAAGKRTES